MEAKAPAMAPVRTIWPQHVGVEGLSMWAAPEQDAARALKALRAWLPALDDQRLDGVELGQREIDAMRPDRFPYAEVLSHYRRVGRAHASAELTGPLRRLSDAVRRPALTGGRRLWPLPQWLPSTVDQHGGNYDSYLVAGLLESVTGTGGADERSDAEVEQATDRTIDLLVAALAADLALVEADALRCAQQSRQQRRRTRGCLLVLSKVAYQTPQCTELPTEDAAAGDPSDGAALAEVTGRLALEVQRRVPEPCRLAVDLSLLPTTPLHDEQMFIRCIQIFETLYRQIYRCLVRAGVAMQTMDVRGACAELADATRRLALSPVLYRVVTTMPRDAFAIIRDYTNGRSAIQSRSYRQIDLVCAPRPPSPVADKLPLVDVTSPTLQDAFLNVAARLDSTEVDLLADHMRALDASWRAMKRTHWGVTLKIIGRVPGTGGTAGADYLKHAAEVPLFPMLAEPAR
jgi:tryptophan 2,3-dioxygenase